MIDLNLDYYIVFFLYFLVPSTVDIFKYYYTVRIIVLHEDDLLSLKAHRRKCK